MVLVFIIDMGEVFFADKVFHPVGDSLFLKIMSLFDWKNFVIDLNFYYLA